jgi:carbonic anhydrase/acetyltransferase-like protein (isoleucine patch superfamily)
MTIRSYNDTSPELGARVFIDSSALVLGDVVIGDDSSIWPMATLRGDMGKIRIGKGTSIQDGSVLHCTLDSPHHPGGYPLTIGDEVTVGHQATLHGCTLENRILVGMKATVMDGAYIPSDVMLGAGCLVASGKKLESGFLYAGSPARRVRELTEEERDYLIYSAQSYIKLKDKHLISQRRK